LSDSVADGYAWIVAVAILSGIAVTYARMPLHLPGHKVLFWMAPLLATRLLTRTAAGSSVGAIVVLATTLSLGGRIAGGPFFAPLIVPAAALLDLTVAMCQRRNYPLWRRAVLLSIAGMLGNLCCSIKQILEVSAIAPSPGQLSDMLVAVGSYALFGLIAGTLGGAVGFGLLRLRGTA
jgi:hypothetical protein